MARPHPARAVLDERGMTVTAFAEALYLHRTHLSRILNGSAPATRRIRRDISLHLGLPESELFYPADETEPQEVTA